MASTWLSFLQLAPARQREILQQQGTKVADIVSEGATSELYSLEAFYVELVQVPGNLVPSLVVHPGINSIGKFLAEISLSGLF